MSRDSAIDLICWLLLGTLSSVWCVQAGERLGATFDEPAYLRVGLDSWRTGDIKQFMTWGTMPLPVHVQTLPIYVYELATGEYQEPIIDQSRLLPVMRKGNLLFWWLLLFYMMLWGRKLAGRWAGRLAMAFAATDPNLLGHACLATTDIALSAMVLVAVYHFVGNRERRWPKRILLPGVLYGLALATKASALPYVPLLCVTLELHRLWLTGHFQRAQGIFGRIRQLWHDTARLRWDLFTVILIGIVTVFGYCGSNWQAERSFVEWADQLPEGPLKGAMEFTARHLTIFPNAGEGIVQQIKHNLRGHGGPLLLGKQYDRSIWYYFPVALTIKLTDGIIILCLLTPILYFRSTRLNPCFWAALVLLLFSLNTKVQIGIRLIFPLFCWLYLYLATTAYSKLPTDWRSLHAGYRLLAWLAVAYAGWQSLQTFPDGVRYINRLYGGAANRTALADSNYDWGQGIPELTEWWRANGEPRLAIWYYGGDTAIFFPPYEMLHLHILEDKSPGAVVDAVGERHIAVSWGLLVACPDRRPETKEMVAWLRSQEPVATTSFFVIYRFSE